MVKCEEQTLYSDLYIDDKTKIEILPSDRINKINSVIKERDQLITVFRSTNNDKFATGMLHDGFLEELLFRCKFHKVNNAIVKTILRFYFSLEANGRPICDSTSDSSVYSLVVYVNPRAKIFCTGSGQITIKQRINRQFLTLNQKIVNYSSLEFNDFLKVVA